MQFSKTLRTMKIIPAVREWCRQHGASSAYLLFALFMLQLAKRGANKHIAHESIVTFWQALVPTELPHKLVALNAAVIWYLRKSKQPVLNGWTGSFAAFFQLLAMHRFVQYHRDNVDAKRHVRDALLVSDIDRHKLHNIGDLSYLQWLCVMLPLPQTLALKISYPGVHSTTVTYAHVGERRTKRLRMDVFRSTTATPANAPILLYVHGGAWVVGKRDRAPMPLIYQIASRGWIVCSVDYRLSPQVAFPDHLIDIKRAVAYLRQNARAEFNADPDFIVVGGESAGGHLASLVALTPTDKSLQPGFEEIDTSVRACVDNYGVHDLTDRHGIYYAKDKDNGFVRFMELVVMQKKLTDESEMDYEVASPVSWLMDDKLQDVKHGQVVPPFLLSHGTHDTLVPFDDSQVFYEHLKRHRQRSAFPPVVDDVFIEVPGAHHAFNYLMSPRSLAYGDAVAAFLENLHTKSKAQERSAGVPNDSSAAALVTPRGASRL